MTAVAYGCSKFICWLFFRLGFGLRVTGQAHVPSRGAFILASNHVSFLDPPLIGAACPRRLAFMARADLFRHGLLGAWMRSVGVISLRRGEQDVGAMRRAIEVLRRGEPIAIFPEGGRQLSGRLGHAKRGVGVLATLAEVPIVPVLVQGTFDALPPGSRGLRKAKIRVAFGPPIAYTSQTVPPDAPPSGGPGDESGARSRRSDHERLAAAVTHAWQRLQEPDN